jgi:hypothetical protein
MQVLAQDLDGNVASKPPIRRAVDGAHSAAAQAARDLVPAVEDRAAEAIGERSTLLGGKPRADLAEQRPVAAAELGQSRLALVRRGRAGASHYLVDPLASLGGHVRILTRAGKALVSEEI